MTSVFIRMMRQKGGCAAKNVFTRQLRLLSSTRPACRAGKYYPIDDVLFGLSDEQRHVSTLIVRRSLSSLKATDYHASSVPPVPHSFQTSSSPLTNETCRIILILLLYAFIVTSLSWCFCSIKPWTLNNQEERIFGESWDFLMSLYKYWLTSPKVPNLLRIPAFTGLQSAADQGSFFEVTI